MEDATPITPKNFIYGHRRPNVRMPYYEYYHKPLGPPLHPFVTKRLPKYASQYIPLHSSRYTLARNIPAHEQELPTRWYSTPGVSRYQPRRGPVRPEPQAATFHKLNVTKGPTYYKPNVTKGPTYYKPNVTKSPTKPHADMYQHPLGTQYPYDGMTKGPYGPINKGSAPCVSQIPLPRLTKGPVMYAIKSPHPSMAKIPLPRVTKGPLLYAADEPLLYAPKDTRVTKGPLPRTSKGPVLHPTKSPQPFASHESQLNVTKEPHLQRAKGTLPRPSKGPRFLATKVPRFSALRPSRSFLKKGSRPNLSKGSQPSLIKGSRPSLTKSSRVSLAKGSQPSLAHNTTYPLPKKLPKNVKISSTGKKYCSATKWPF